MRASEGFKDLQALPRSVISVTYDLCNIQQVGMAHMEQTISRQDNTNAVMLLIVHAESFAEGCVLCSNAIG